MIFTNKLIMRLSSCLLIIMATFYYQAPVLAQNFSNNTWQDDLNPVEQRDWNYDFAAHLLERAGFGGTPAEIQALAELSPEAAVAQFVYTNPNTSNLPSFVHSGIHDAGIEPFPPSRPAVTELAKETGQALGIQIKPEGNRRLQPVVNKFFYWLRASLLETNRVSYWWADRMVNSPYPLEEKMALFWHGHFANSETKVRDYRKLLLQLELFHAQGMGNFHELMIAIAQSPGMLSFLDAGVNVKGAANENFAREIMELFTMGVDNYTEQDIREAARAFTGWNYVDLTFTINDEQHDNDEKTFLGRSGNFDGVDIINIIMEQPATADYIASKIYRFFVREELSPELAEELGKVLRDSNYNLKPLLEIIFLSRDFYSPASVGTQIKSPVHLAVSSYRKLGLKSVPGVPDFNSATNTLGQHLFFPPTVAGWAEGRSWITPGLLLERGNFARDILFPDINFMPPDRLNGNPEIRRVADRIRQGLDISTATMPDSDTQVVAESNMSADRDEDFNTRYGSFRGWQMAIEKVIAIPRNTAQINLSEMVLNEELTDATEVVDYFLMRFMRVAPAEDVRQSLVTFLEEQLGTSNISLAESYMEDSLRLLLHLIMSQPEYQLG